MDDYTKVPVLVLDQTIMGLYQNEKPAHDIDRPTTCNTWEWLCLLNDIIPKDSNNIIIHEL